MKKNWMVFDYDNGTEFFETELDANAFAENYLDSYRDEAGEGWDEGVEQLVVAKVARRIEKHDEQPITEGENGHGDFDYRCDYKFVSV